MWPFSKPAPTTDLEERLEKVERALRDLQADWDSTYDKFAMLLKRWAKREKATVAAVENDVDKPLRDLVSGRW